MPSVPVTWLDDFVANLNVGSQSDPVITQLASGYILVVWTDSDNSSAAGAPPGSEIVGRIFDPLGNPATDEFRLNIRNINDSEFNPTITALPNGNFVVAYDESGGSFDDLSIETYSFNPSTGAVWFANNNDLFFDTGTSNPVDPSIAAASNTSVLAAYHTINADGSDNVVIRTHDPSTGIVGAEIVIFAGNTGTGEDVSGPDVAALTSGNYAVTYVNQNPAGTADAVIVEVRDQAGGFVNSATVATLDVGGISDPQVAALSSGNFVVAYNVGTNSGDIQFRAFSNSGAPLAGGGPFTVGNNAASENEPAIIGLADGSFVIVWDDDTTGQIVGNRYSISGSSVFSVTGNFVIDNSGGFSITEIELEAFDDGRFAVTWNDGGDIRVKIMDTRDTVNGTAVYSPTSQQIGTVGNDVFTADGSAGEVYGYDGNDVITESGSIKKYFGGNGDDTLIVVSPINDDVHDGGAGSNDTIDWSLSNVFGATFDLLNGVASDAFDSEVMTGFENLIATENADIIFGSNGQNKLTALGGNDTIEGGFSTDTIDAGDGNDLVTVREGQFADNVAGGTGNDTYVFDYQNFKISINLQTTALQVFDSGGFTFGPANTVTGVENVTGGDLDDSITGDALVNILDGGNGADTINAGAENDVIIITAASHHDAGEVIDGGTGTSDRIRFTSSIAGDNLVLTSGVTNVEIIEITNATGSAGGTTALSINAAALTYGTTLKGNAGVNTIIGTSFVDVIEGNGGNDTIEGKSGSDTLRGGDGNDVFQIAFAVHHGATEVIDGGAGATDRIRFTSTTANDTLNLVSGVTNVEIIEITNAAGSAGGSTTLNINAGALTYGVTLNGNAGINTITGTGFIDTINGNAGNDIIEGGAGSDTLNGGDGNDVFLLGTTSHFTAAEVISGGAGTADRIRFTSTTAGQTLTLTANVTGVEFVDISNAAGSAGGTTQLNVSAAALTAAVTLSGNAGNNTLTGSAFNDTLNGNLGNDTLNGGAGVDTLNGGGGNDIFRFANSLGASNIDTIVGYVVADDRIELDNAFFTALADGFLFNNAFVANTTGQATTATQRIIYETDTGALYYDSNGSAAGGTYQQFAQVSAGLAMTASEFLVI